MAEKEVTVVVNLDTSDLIAGLAKTNDAVEAVKVSADDTGKAMKQSFSGTKKALQEVDEELLQVHNSLKKTSDPVAIANLKKYEQELINEAKELNKVSDATKKVTTSSTSMRTELRSLVQEMARLDLAGQKNSQTYTDLSKRAGTIKDAMMDASVASKNMGSDTRNVDGMVQGISSLVGAFSVYQSVAVLVGSDNKELQETMVKLMATMTLMSGVQEIATALQKESALMTLLQNTQQKANVVITNLQTASTTGATVAQRALNLAMAASPIGLLIAGVAALVAGIVIFTNSNNDAEASQKALNAELKQADKAIKQLNQSTEDNIALMKARGDSQTDILKLELQSTRAISAINDKSISDLISNYANLSDTQKEELKKREDQQETYNRNITKLENELLVNTISQQRQIEDLKIANMADGFAKEKAEIIAEYDKQVKLAGSNTELITQLTIKKNKDILKAQKESNKETVEEQKRFSAELQSAIDEINITYRDNVKTLNDEFKKSNEYKVKLTKFSLDEINALEQDRIEDIEKYYSLVAQTTQAGTDENTKSLLKLEDERYKKEKEKYKGHKDILLQLEREHNQNVEKINEDAQSVQLEKLKNIAEKTASILSSAIAIYFDFQKQKNDEQAQEIDERYTLEEERLQKQLERKTISQEQFDAKMKVLQENRAKEEKALKHKAFEEERSAKIVQATIAGIVGAVAQYEAGPAGIALSAIVAALAAAQILLIAAEKNPYEKGTAQILRGKSHKEGGISLGQFGTAEDGEFLGILQKRKTQKFGKGLMNLFDGLNQSNSQKIAFGLTDIAAHSGFTGNNSSTTTLALQEVPEIRRIEKILRKEQTSTTYHNGYRVVKSGNITRRIND